MASMSEAQWINRAEDFLQTRFKQQLLQAAGSWPDVKSLYIPYSELEHVDYELAECLLHTPSMFFTTMGKALQNILPPDIKKPLTIRISDMPLRKNITTFPVRDLVSNNITNYVTVEGLVRKVSETLPHLVKGAFQCERCGTIQYIVQDGDILKEPLACDQEAGGCGSPIGRTRFKLIIEANPLRTEDDEETNPLSEFEDAQFIEIQEPHENLRGGQQPRPLQAMLRKDLINTVFPGNRVYLSGILKAKRRGGPRSQSPYYHFYLEVNSVKVIDTDYEEIEITKADEEQILGLSKDPQLKKKMVDSIAPSIFGMEVEKEAILLQLFGGVPKELEQNIHLRGDIHVLMVGDPGVAKSQLLTFVARTSPRGIYASGKGSSTAGLTAAAVREPADFTGDSRWMLEAGALVLADKGICCIDEFDKMADTDRDSIHAAMEQQVVRINKAGISAVMMSRCPVLAAANPKLGRYDTFKSLPEQIELDPALLSRFDIIIPVVDSINEERDHHIADHIIETHMMGEAAQHQGPEYEKVIEEIKAKRGQPISPDFLRKYIAYARKNIVPVMTREDQKTIDGYYVSMRRRSEHGAVQMTPRNVEAIIRLTEASAKLHLRVSTTPEDCETAIRIVRYFLESSCRGEDGKIDTDIISTGLGASQRDRIWTLMDIISNIQGTDGASVDDIMRLAEERGMPISKVTEDIERLKRDGRIYERFEGRYRIG